jgi:hypothetical protein
VTEPRLRTAALALVRAMDAHVDALNGQGHPGEPHDDALYFGGIVRDMIGDCAACGGAQYSAEDAEQRAAVAVKLALGEPLRPYETALVDVEVRA